MLVTAPIDRARYFFVPRTSGRRLLALARLLGKHKPKELSFEGEERAKLLQHGVVTLAQAYVERHRESSSLLAADETALDQFADYLWGIVDDRLAHWEAFGLPAASRLAQQKPGNFDYAARIDKAREAFALRRQLLAEGLDFTRRPYAEQAEYMVTLWKVIEQDKLDARLNHLIGADFFEALRDVHDHYVAMVERRSSRAQGSAVNLRELALALQKDIQNYVIALLAMIRDDDPDNVAMIRAALRPIDALREQLERERARTRGEPPPPAANDTGADVEELLAEEQEVATAIGEPETPQGGEINPG